MGTFRVAILGLVVIAFAAVGAATMEAHWVRGERTFHTDSKFSRGTELRIRIKKPGKDTTLEIVRWEGKKKGNPVLKSWRGSSLSEGEILRYRLRERMKVGLRVSGDKVRKPKEKNSVRDFHRLHFGGGWVIDVKLVGDEF